MSRRARFIGGSSVGILLGTCLAALSLFGLSQSLGATKAKSPAVKVSVKQHRNRCKLVVAVKGAPEGAGVLVQVPPGKRWKTAFARKAKPGNSRIQLPCTARYAGARVRAILKQGKHKVARSKVTRQPTRSALPKQANRLPNRRRLPESPASSAQPASEPPPSGPTTEAVPDTAIDAGPTGLVASPDAAFAYSGSPAGVIAGYECRLDSSAFQPCPSAGRPYTGLPDGPHQFSVRALNASSQADPTPATRAWEVDTAASETSIDSALPPFVVPNLDQEVGTPPAGPARPSSAAWAKPASNPAPPPTSCRSANQAPTNCKCGRSTPTTFPTPPGHGRLHLRRGGERCGTLTEDETWSTDTLSGVVLTCAVTVPEGVTLTVKPGVFVKSGGGAIEVQGGTLKAEGTEAEPVVFTSMADDSVGGDTGGSSTAHPFVNIRVNDGTLSLDHAQLRGAQDESLTLSGNCSGGCDELDPNLTASVKNTDLEGPLLAGWVDLSGFATEGAEANHFSGSPSQRAIVLREEVLWGQTLTLAPALNATLWGYQPGTPDPVKIKGGGQLRLRPGTFMKVETEVFDTGTLKAEGTEAEPVVFTSMADDSVGGDTGAADRAPLRQHPGQRRHSLPRPRPAARRPGRIADAERQLQRWLRRTRPQPHCLGEEHRSGRAAACRLGGPLRLCDRGRRSQPLQRLAVPTGDRSARRSALGPDADPGPGAERDALGLPARDAGPGEDQRGGQLRLRPGTFMKVETEVFDTGTLKAEGTEAEPVVFTSMADDSVGGDTGGSSTAHPFVNIRVNDGTLSLDHAQLRGAQDESLTLSGNCSGGCDELDPNLTASVKNTDLEGPLLAGWVDLSGFATEGAEANHFSGSPSQRAIVLREEVLWGQTLTLAPALNATLWGYQPGTPDPVKIKGGGQLRLRPGTFMKVETEVFDTGTLKAEGTEAEPVVFTSMADDSVGGDTGGSSTAHPFVNIRVNDGTLSLDHAQLRGAQDESLTLSGNCSGGCDELDPNLTASVKNTDLEGPLLAGWVDLSGFATEGAEANHFSGSPSQRAIVLREEVLWGQTLTLAPALNATLWGYQPGTPDPVKIKGGGQLRLRPGTFMKVETEVFDTGTLKAEGTEAEPVVFTSMADDSVGGDTGGSSTAHPFVNIRVNDGTLSLDHAQLRGAQDESLTLSGNCSGGCDELDPNLTASVKNTDLEGPLLAGWVDLSGFATEGAEANHFSGSPSQRAIVLREEVLWGQTLTLAPALNATLWGYQPGTPDPVKIKGAVNCGCVPAPS